MIVFSYWIRVLFLSLSLFILSLNSSSSMPFSLLVAADLYGSKVNLELTLPHLPSLTELNRFTETTFAVESSSVRPSGHPFRSFKVARFHLFDDVSQEWVELGSPSLLTEYCQLYAFQQDVSESQQQIPPPRLPTSGGAGGFGSTSPRRNGTLSPNRHVTPKNEVPAAFAASYTATKASSGTPIASRPSTSAAYKQDSSHMSMPSRYHDDSHHASVVADRSSRYIGDDTRLSQGVDRSRAASYETGNEALLSSKQRQYNEAQPTTDYKLRTLFDEMDSNHNRRIEADEFRRVLKILNLDIPATSVSELFRHADMDNDGVVSFGEFEQCFGRLYPTLLDSMFYRFREYYEDLRRREIIEKRKAALRGLEAEDASVHMQAKDYRRKSCKASILWRRRPAHG